MLFPTDAPNDGDIRGIPGAFCEKKGWVIVEAKGWRNHAVPVAIDDLVFFIEGSTKDPRESRNWNAGDEIRLVILDRHHALVSNRARQHGESSNPHVTYYRVHAKRIHCLHQEGCVGVGFRDFGRLPEARLRELQAASKYSNRYGLRRAVERREAEERPDVID